MFLCKGMRYTRTDESANAAAQDAADNGAGNAAVYEGLPVVNQLEVYEIGHLAG